MNTLNLQKILELHKKWLFNEDGGAAANLYEADLSAANLSETDFFRANFSRANLSGANLSGANFFGADLSWVDFSGANLSGADFSRANLSWANLSRTELYEADFSEANLSGVDLSRANLSSTNLYGVSSCHCEYLMSIFLGGHPIVYTSECLQIGCERHLISEWKEFNDRRILEMDGKDALIFWNKYKDFIFQAIDLSPAKPTNSNKEDN